MCCIWEKHIPTEQNSSSKINVNFDEGIAFDLRRFILQFCNFIEMNYYVPLDVCIHISNESRIKAKDGDLVTGLCNYEYDKISAKTDNVEVRIATGDYDELVENLGDINAAQSIMCTLSHELTHYQFAVHYPKMARLKIIDILQERLANYYNSKLLEQFMLDVYDSKNCDWKKNIIFSSYLRSTIKSTDEIYFHFSSWLNSLIKNDFPVEGASVNFNIYPELEGTFAIDITVLNRIDEVDYDYWYCDEEYNARNNLFFVPIMPELSERQDGLKFIAHLINTYLDNGDFNYILKQYKTIAVGFTDADMKVIFPLGDKIHKQNRGAYH